MFVLLRSVVQHYTLSVHFTNPLHTADLGLRISLQKDSGLFQKAHAAAGTHCTCSKALALPEEGEGR